MNKDTETILAHMVGITYTPDGTATGPDGPFQIPTVHVDHWDPDACRGEVCYYGDWYFTLWSHAYATDVAIILRDHAEPDAGYHLGDIPASDVPSFFRDVVNARLEPDTLIQRADTVEPAQ